MSDAAIKKRQQRARWCARKMLEQAGYKVSIYHGVLTATRRSEVRHIFVCIDRRDIPRPGQLPPGYEVLLKTGRAKFEFK